MSKSTFYEHQTLYGDSACEFSNGNEEIELDVHSDSENEGIAPCWDDEDRQFFSEEDNSSGDDEDGDSRMVPEESSLEGQDSPTQPGQQLLVSSSIMTVSTI